MNKKISSKFLMKFVVFFFSNFKAKTVNVLSKIFMVQNLFIQTSFDIICHLELHFNPWALCERRKHTHANVEFEIQLFVYVNIFVRGESALHAEMKGKRKKMLSTRMTAMKKKMIYN